MTRCALCAGDIDRSFPTELRNPFRGVDKRCQLSAILEHNYADSLDVLRRVCMVCIAETWRVSRAMPEWAKSSLRLSICWMACQKLQRKPFWSKRKRFETRSHKNWIDGYLNCSTSRQREAEMIYIINCMYYKSHAAAKHARKRFGIRGSVVRFKMGWSTARSNYSTKPIRYPSDLDQVLLGDTPRARSLVRGSLLDVPLDLRLRRYKMRKVRKEKPWRELYGHTRFKFKPNLP